LIYYLANTNMKIISIILILFFISCESEELSKEQIHLKNSAITIKNLTDLNNKLYEGISNYNIVMIGEMHGTNEPAEFAYGICKLFNQNEKQVIMAMEIPPSQMNGFNQNMSIDDLKKLSFFAGENSSGMNGEAWLNLIANCNQHKNIIVKFFDNQKTSSRDSSMYNGIVEIRNTYPSSKIVTLSGNLHNRFEPFNGNKMLGTYLVNDEENFDKEKIMSIMHYFNHGTMMNNVGNGLELRTIEPKEDLFNKSISAKMFFCENIFEDKSFFTHILYTDQVTHSKALQEK